ncbi:MAG: hypothetical protein HOP31_11250 [Ignavibacteria bacterium]|nr:hypothetical protein [Ignavibacteria bacterium]
MNSKIFLQKNNLLRTFFLLLFTTAAIYTAGSLYEPAFNLFAQGDSTGGDTTELPADSTNGGEVQTDNPLEPTQVKDASQMFNERGFSRSSSINFDGSEIINDFNGNLIYEIPLYQYKVSNSLDFNMKLTYNGSVNHEVFLADTTYCLTGRPACNRYNINAPEWIVSVNGIAVQVMNFETRFLSKPNSNGVSGYELRKLIPGYHYSDGFKSLSASDFDRINILTGDGSTISLINKAQNQYTGTYYSDEKGSHIKAEVVFDYSDPETLPWKKRKMELFMGDGLIYSFNEKEVSFYDLRNTTVEPSKKPMAFFLQLIRDQFGNTIGMNYQHLNEQWGRDVFDASYGIKFNYNFNGIIVDDNSGETGRYKLHFSDFAAYTETIQGSKMPMLSIITNPLQQQTTAEYESYSRNLSNLPCNYSNTNNINISANDLRRIKIIKNFLGGKREYGYYSPAVSGLTYLNSDTPLRSDNNTFKGNGRDPFFCNMLSSKKDIDNTEQKCLTEYLYEFTDSNTSFNELPADHTDYYCTRKAISSLDGTTLNNSEGNVSVKEYKFYPVKNYGIIINEYKDLGSVNKLIREKTLKPNASTFEEINYEYHTGNFNVFFNGSFLTTKKKVTTEGQNREWNFSYLYKSSSPDSLIIQKTEIDPLGSKVITDMLNIEQAITFYDNQRLKSQNGGALVSYGIKLFYKTGIDTVKRLYDINNNLLKKTEKRYILTENNDSGYFGQIISDKEFAEGSSQDAIENRFIYYRKDTLAMYMYGTSGLPYIEGNLKRVLKPENQEERFFYYPVSYSESHCGTGDEIPGGQTGGNPPKIAYKIKFSSGNDSTAWEYFYNTKLPIRIENYKRLSGGCDTLKRIYTKYNQSGTPLLMIDENRYASRFMYEPRYNRISSVTLPGDFESNIVVDTMTYIDTNYYYDTLTLVSESWGTNDELNGTLYFLNNPAYFAPWYNGVGACRCFNTHVECNSSGTIVTKSNAFMKFDGEILPKFVNISFAELRFPVAKYDKFIGGNPAPAGSVISTLRPFSNLGTISGYDCEGRGISKSTTYTPENSFGSNFNVDTNQGGCNKNQFINITSMLHNYIVGSNKQLKGFDIKQSPNGIGGEDTPPNYVFKLYCVPCDYNWVSWRDNNIPRLKIYGKIDASDTLKKVSSNGATFRYEYDDDSNTVILKSILKNSSPVKEKRIKYHFDGFGNIKRKDLYNSDFNFDSLLYRFNFLNKPARNFDGTGDTAMFSYDFAGRQTKTKNADTSSSLVSYSYQNGISAHLAGYTGFVEKHAYTDETGRIFNKYFDAVGNLLREEKFVAGDSSGNIQSEDNPFNPDTTIQLDNPPQMISLYTDYQYDALYRLIKVRTPEGKLIQYWYDRFGRQMQRNTADAGLTKYSYDKNGNLLLSQDANQFNAAFNLFTARTYDGLNRLLTIGDKKDGNVSPPGGTGIGGDTTLPEEFDFPQNADSLYVINVYDTVSLAPVSDVFTDFPTGYSQKNFTRGRLAATAFRTRLGEPWSYKYYRYDERGNIVKYWVKIDGLGWKEMTNTYNSQNMTTKFWYQPNQTDGKVFTYAYDDAGRLNSADWYIGSNPILPEELNDYPGNYLNLVKYTYNQDQQISQYKYDDNNNLAYVMNYNNRNWLYWHNRVGGSAVLFYNLNYYLNGNIKQQTLAGTYKSSFGNTENLTFNYIYDNSNRLVKSSQTTNKFDLINSYDKDGNLKSLKRSGATGNSVDNFNYEYYNGSNRLKKVTQNQADYTYDANGNLTSDDLNKNNQMKYDWRNLMTENTNVLSQTTHRAQYWYDESGNRVRKLVQMWQPGGGGIEGGDGSGSWNTVTITYYVRDAGGKEIAIYSGSTLEQWNLYGNDQIGYIDNTGKRSFYLKDHLVTIRATIDSTNTVLSAQDVDAWGYQLENRSFSNANQRYKFTGKEKDKDLENNYDYFGARYYDNRIGRWNGVEPLLEKYLDVTPYQYGLLNPMRFLDFNGLDNYVFNENGYYVRTDKTEEKKLVIENSQTFEQSYYDFNDPDKDVNDIEYLINTYGKDAKMVFIKSQTDIDYYMDLAEADNLLHQFIGGYIHALKESPHEGRLDFWHSYLKPEMIAGDISPADIKSDRGAFFIFDKGNKTYNAMDAGNFLWGYAMAKMHVPLQDALLGAHYYQFREGGEISKGSGFIDSGYDQQAIMDGHKK